jgi:hypothetical protein
VPLLLAAGHTVDALARTDAAEAQLRDLGADVRRGSIDDLAAITAGAAESDGVIDFANTHDFTNPLAKKRTPLPEPVDQNGHTMYERLTADTDQDFVVFILGMRVNRWASVRSWRPVIQAMPRMLTELRANPDLGMMKAYSCWLFGGPAALQYWRSFDDLLAYSRKSDAAHLPAWRDFNRAAAKTDAVGIWHETYKISSGQWEAIYGGMSPVGLAGAVGQRSLKKQSTAEQRLASGRAGGQLEA